MSFLKEKYRLSGAFSKCSVRDGVLTKTYVAEKLRSSFKIEIECLKRLKGHPYFPQIIDYDSKDMSIRMTYVGVSLDKSDYRTTSFDYDTYKANLEYIADTLIVNNIYYYDIQRRNICFDGKSLYLIDFNHKCQVDGKSINREDFLKTIKLKLIK